MSVDCANASLLDLLLFCIHARHYRWGKPVEGDRDLSVLFFQPPVNLRLFLNKKLFLKPQNLHREEKLEEV